MARATRRVHSVEGAKWQLANQRAKFSKRLILLPTFATAHLSPAFFQHQCIACSHGMVVPALKLLRAFKKHSSRVVTGC